MDGFLKLNQVKGTLVKDMLYQSRTCLILLIFSFFFSCDPNKKKKDSYTTQMVIDFCTSKIGKNEYRKIYDMMSDSISKWEKNGLRSWKIERSTVEFKIDSVLCINEKLDKIVTAHLGRQLLPSGTLDGIAYFYGVKIKGEWYFFSGPTIYVPRDKKHLDTATSFTKLHEIAMDNIFKGYLKKDKLGKWEINDNFFSGFAPKNQTADGYGSCFGCKTEDEYYLYLVNKNWRDRAANN